MNILQWFGSNPWHTMTLVGAWMVLSFVVSMIGDVGRNAFDSWPDASIGVAGIAATTWAIYGAVHARHLAVLVTLVIALMVCAGIAGILYWQSRPLSPSPNDVRSSSFNMLICIALLGAAVAGFFGIAFVPFSA